MIVGLTLSANFSAGMSLLAMSPILPLISEEYQIGRAAAGLLVGVAVFMVAAFALPGGVIAARLGTRRIYVASLLMMGLSTLTALSPSFEVLLALRVVYGLGLALMWPAAAPLLMQWFRPKELPLINSLNISCFLLASAVSLSTIAPISEVVGWERALGLFAAVSLVAAVVWLFWGKSQENVGEVAAPLNLGAVKDVLRNRVILVLAAADVAAFSQYAPG